MSQNTPMQDTCLHCNSPDYEPGFKVRLCRPCRTRFSNYPVSKRIIAGGVLLGLLVLFSLFRSFWDIRAAYFYEKGLFHFSRREYSDANKAFYHTTRIYRNHAGAEVHWLTVAYYNMYENESMDLYLDKIEETTYQKDPALLEEVQTIKHLLTRDRAQAHNIDTAMKLYTAQQLPRADSIFAGVMHACPGYLTAYIMHAKCLRRQHQFAAARKICDKALEYNHQLHAAIKEKDTIQALIHNQSL